jgi:hypothetical protein
VTAARLAGWAGDARLPALDRCLALAALAAARSDARHHRPRPRRRRRQPTPSGPAPPPRPATTSFAGLLRDPSPRVRAAASFVLAACPRARPARDPGPRRRPRDVTRPAPRRPPHRPRRPRPPAIPARPPCTWHLLDAGEPTRHDASEALGWVDRDLAPDRHRPPEPAPPGPRPRRPPLAAPARRRAPAPPDATIQLHPSRFSNRNFAIPPRDPRTPRNQSRIFPSAPALLSSSACPPRRPATTS